VNVAPSTPIIKTLVDTASLLVAAATCKSENRGHGGLYHTQFTHLILWLHFTE